MKKRVINLKIVHILITVILCLILATEIFCKILQVSGTSMEPTLNKGEILLMTDFSELKKGDIVAFYYNDNLLIKRIIAKEGDIVNIEYDGTVYVNSTILEENYISKKILGNNCDITFPYQVPENSIFVLGDNRETSIDSRNQAIGCISQNNIIGKIQFKLNPFVIY